MFKRFVRQFKYGKKGFTLIELLVVVAILGVLAAVAIPNVAKFISGGTLSAANSEVATVQTAQAAYMIDHGNAALATIDSAADNAIKSEGYIDKPIKGSYDFDATGKMTAASYPDGGLTWDGTLGQFKK